MYDPYIKFLLMLADHISNVLEPVLEQTVILIKRGGGNSTAPCHV
jgi:hypothetical protein